MKNNQELINTQTGLSNKIIGLINTVFAKYPSIQKAVLYGSRAKGNYRNGSDIDLTLFSEIASNSLLIKVLVDLDELLLPYMIDLSFYASIENDQLKEHIDRVGIVFYERKNL